MQAQSTQTCHSWRLQVSDIGSYLFLSASNSCFLWQWGITAYLTPILYTIFFCISHQQNDWPWCSAFAYVSSAINFQFWFSSSMSVQWGLPGVFPGNHWIQEQASLGTSSFLHLKSFLFYLIPSCYRKLALFPNSFWPATLYQSYLSAFPWICFSCSSLKISNLLFEFFSTDLESRLLHYGPQLPSSSSFSTQLFFLRVTHFSPFCLQVPASLDLLAWNWTYFHSLNCSLLHFSIKDRKELNFSYFRKFQRKKLLICSSGLRSGCWSFQISGNVGKFPKTSREGWGMALSRLCLNSSHSFHT